MLGHSPSFVDYRWPGIFGISRFFLLRHQRGAVVNAGGASLPSAGTERAPGKSSTVPPVRQAVPTQPATGCGTLSSTQPVSSLWRHPEPARTVSLWAKFVLFFFAFRRASLNGADLPPGMQGGSTLSPRVMNWRLSQGPQTGSSQEQCQQGRTTRPSSGSQHQADEDGNLQISWRLCPGFEALRREKKPNTLTMYSDKGPGESTDRSQRTRMISKALQDKWDALFFGTRPHKRSYSLGHAGAVMTAAKEDERHPRP